ncbi:MAG: GrpB family protein [Ardenticatenaceae bacterium]|nr:GrpB family protein [Ardenticatenaceae bacterium]
MVEIVEYQENWPHDFQLLASALRQALGDLAVRIDHIGSTSVPGLAAKDRIDMQLTVASFDDFAPIEAALATLGYTVRSDVRRDHNPDHSQTDAGTDPQWAKRLCTAPAGQRPTNLHIRVNGRLNQRYPLLFRDYLRQHPPTAHTYAALKRQLAHYLPDNLHAYADIKDPACDLIMQLAEKWAAETGWQPGKSGA